MPRSPIQAGQIRQEGQQGEGSAHQLGAPPALHPPARLAVWLPHHPPASTDRHMWCCCCSPSIIPYWVAVVVPLAAGLLSFAAGELLLARHPSWTTAAALALHFTLDYITALAVTLTVTQVGGDVAGVRPGDTAGLLLSWALPAPGTFRMQPTACSCRFGHASWELARTRQEKTGKQTWALPAAPQALKVSVGRLRPDYLALCQPAMPAAADLTLTYGQPASANPACNAPPSSTLTDGHYSFPSGHTSTGGCGAGVVVGSGWCGRRAARG